MLHVSKCIVGWFLVSDRYIYRIGTKMNFTAKVECSGRSRIYEGVGGQSTPLEVSGGMLPQNFRPSEVVSGTF